jgi:hypothetical protein
MGFFKRPESTSFRFDSSARRLCSSSERIAVVYCPRDRRTALGVRRIDVSPEDLEALGNLRGIVGNLDGSR